MYDVKTGDPCRYVSQFPEGTCMRLCVRIRPSASEKGAPIQSATHQVPSQLALCSNLFVCAAKGAPLSNQRVRSLPCLAASYGGSLSLARTCVVSATRLRGRLSLMRYTRETSPKIRLRRVRPGSVRRLLEWCGGWVLGRDGASAGRQKQRPASRLRDQ